MAKKRRFGLIFLLILIALIGLFLSGVMQKWLADGSRKATAMIEKKHFPDDEIHLLDAYRNMPAYSIIGDDYFDFLSELHQKDPGKLLRIAATMNAICLMTDEANNLRFEFLAMNGITHPKSAEIWYKITSSVADQVSSGDRTFAMGLIYYRLFWNEHIRLTQQPHPDFETYRPLIIKRIQSKDNLYNPPAVSSEIREIQFGDPNVQGSDAFRIKRGWSTLQGRYTAIKDFGLSNWFYLDKSAW